MNFSRVRNYALAALLGVVVIAGAIKNTLGAQMSRTAGIGPTSNSSSSTTIDHTTGTITSGKFGDDRVNISSGALTWAPSLQSALDTKLSSGAVPTSFVNLATVTLAINSSSNTYAWKSSARLGTTAALPTNVYSNGSSGVGATLTASSIGTLTIDGTSPAVGDRVLIKNEATGANNGIYIVGVNGAGSLYVLTRTNDFNTAAEVTEGAAVFVDEGTTNADQGFIQTAIVATVGTDALSFNQFSGAGSFNVGNALSKSGNTVSLASTVTVQGNGFSVGGTTFSVLGGNVGVGGGTRTGYNFYVSSGNAAFDYGVVAATGNFIGSTGGYSIKTATGIALSSGTLSLGTQASIWFGDGTSMNTAPTSGGLSSVSADASLRGNGTSGNPLKLGTTATVSSFTTTASAGFSVISSTGLEVSSGTLRMGPTSGGIVYPDGTSQVTAFTGIGVTSATLLANVEPVITSTVDTGIDGSTLTLTGVSGRRRIRYTVGLPIRQTTAGQGCSCTPICNGGYCDTTMSGAQGYIGTRELGGAAMWVIYTTTVPAAGNYTMSLNCRASGGECDIWCKLNSNGLTSRCPVRLEEE